MRVEMNERTPLPEPRNGRDLPGSQGAALGARFVEGGVGSLLSLRNQYSKCRPKASPAAADAPPVPCDNRRMESLYDPDSRRRARGRLRRLDPRLGHWIGHLDDPWSGRPRPVLRALSALIIDQQISVHAARAIRRRFHAAIGGQYRADSILALSDAQLRAAGLSAPKQRTLRAIASEIASGRLNWASLHRLPDDQLCDRLEEIPGIGPWTSRTYLLFVLGRPDVLPSGDLGLQNAAQKLDGLRIRPSAAGLERMAERWRPVRSLACSYLWALLRSESTPAALRSEG